MKTRVILFYPEGNRFDEDMETALDREIDAQALEPLGVSALSVDNIPEERRTLPYLAPETMMEAGPDFVLIMGVPHAHAAVDDAKGRLKRILPRFLLKLARWISILLLSRRNKRRWKKYPGWGKPIERRPDMSFPDPSPLAAFGVPAERVFPGRVLTLPGYRTEDYVQLRRQGISFISDNCWGGLMYHTLGMEMRSPFINMFVRREHFMRLMSDLPHYLEQPLVPLRPRRNTTAASVYPVMLLGDVELHFNHVNTPEELPEYAEKWYRRRDRILPDRIFGETSFADREDYERFRQKYEAWPFGKIAFVPFPAEGDGIVYLRSYETHRQYFKEGFRGCTRSLAKNDYPGGIPYDFLGTYLTGHIQPPLDQADLSAEREELTHAIS